MPRRQPWLRRRSGRPKGWRVKVPADGRLLSERGVIAEGADAGPTPSPRLRPRMNQARRTSARRGFRRYLPFFRISVHFSATAAP